MISFNLHCEHSHEFEGWFASSSDFERQQAAFLLSCPVCGSSKVRKSLMAPAVSTSRKKQAAMAVGVAGELVGEGASAAHGARSRREVAMAPAIPLPAELVEKVREFKRQVLANSEDVGERFVEEARKIHYGEVEQKAIVGKASLEDAAQLHEEGIDVLPLPVLPEDKN